MSIFMYDLRGLKWPKTKNGPKPKLTLLLHTAPQSTLLHNPHCSTLLHRFSVLVSQNYPFCTTGDSFVKYLLLPNHIKN